MIHAGITSTGYTKVAKNIHWLRKTVAIARGWFGVFRASATRETMDTMSF